MCIIFTLLGHAGVQLDSAHRVSPAEDQNKGDKTQSCSSGLRGKSYWVSPDDLNKDRTARCGFQEGNPIFITCAPDTFFKRKCYNQRGNNTSDEERHQWVYINSKIWTWMSINIGLLSYFGQYGDLKRDIQTCSMLSEGKRGTDDTFGMYVMKIIHMWAVKVQKLKVMLVYSSRFILPNKSYESSRILDWILNSLNLILMSRTTRAQERTWDKIMSVCAFIQSWWCWRIKSNTGSREASQTSVDLTKAFVYITGPEFSKTIQDI